MKTQISIIVCTYNRDKYIYKTLEHIAQNDFPKQHYEIILVDNNSTDRTVPECARFRQNYPDIPFFYFLEANQGLSFARNRGIAEARGDILVFLDDDAFMHKNYLHNLKNNLKNHPASAFGGKIIPEYETGQPPVWMSKWSYIWVSALDKGDKICLFEGKSFPIGANMGFRRTEIPADGFNTTLGRKKGNLMGGEEKDIFNRMKAREAKIYYFPDVEVRHIIPEKRTTRAYIRQLALGVGMSERLRTRKISGTTYLKRILSEIIKWGASCTLCLGYLLKCTPQKGTILIYFRWYVTRGLLSADNKIPR